MQAEDLATWFLCWAHEEDFEVISHCGSPVLSESWGEDGDRVCLSPLVLVASQGLSKLLLLTSTPCVVLGKWSILPQLPWL